MSLRWALVFHSTTDHELVLTDWPQFKTWCQNCCSRHYGVSVVESGDLWSDLCIVTSECVVLGQVFLRFHLCLYTTWLGVVPLFIRLLGGFHETRERDWCIMSGQNLAAPIRGLTYPSGPFQGQTVDLKQKCGKEVTLEEHDFFIFCFFAKVTSILSFTFISKAFSR